MEGYRSHSHSVSSCKYHFVWCPKSSKAKLCVRRVISDPAQYRHPVLDVVEGDVRELFGETANHFCHEILALEIADDHVHFLCKQTRSIVRRTLLGNSSRTRVSTCWSSIPKFGSHIFGVADSGRLGTTWERRERCRKKWLNGISKRRNRAGVTRFIPAHGGAGNSRCFSFRRFRLSSAASAMIC